MYSGSQNAMILADTPNHVSWLHRKHQLITHYARVIFYSPGIPQKCACFTIGIKLGFLLIQTCVSGSRDCIARSQITRWASYTGKSFHLRLFKNISIIVHPYHRISVIVCWMKETFKPNDAHKDPPPIGLRLAQQYNTHTNNTSH